MKASPSLPGPGYFRPNKKGAPTPRWKNEYHRSGDYADLYQLHTSRSLPSRVDHFPRSRTDSATGKRIRILPCIDLNRCCNVQLGNLTDPTQKRQHELTSPKHFGGGFGTATSSNSKSTPQVQPAAQEDRESEHWDHALRLLRDSPGESKSKAWFISMLEFLAENNIPPGVDALRAALKNKCGTLSHAFARMDYNDNGELSMLEFVGGLALLIPPLGRCMGEEGNALRILTGMTESALFKVLDCDKQGTISLLELCGEGAVRMKQQKRQSALKQIDFGLPSYQRKSSLAARIKGGSLTARLAGLRSQENTHDGLRQGGKLSAWYDVIDAAKEGAHQEPKNRVSLGDSLNKVKNMVAFSSLLGEDSVKEKSDSPKRPSSPARRATIGNPFVLVAQWTTLLARQKSHGDDDEDSASDNDIDDAVDYAEQMMENIFTDSCGGYKKRGTHLLTRPKFREFFNSLDTDLGDHKLHALYDSQMQLQVDLTMATFGVSITEGLTYESFRVTLHRAVMQLKLNLHRVIGDLVEDYEKIARTKVGKWKRSSIS